MEKKDNIEFFNTETLNNTLIALTSMYADQIGEGQLLKETIMMGVGIGSMHDGDTKYLHLPERSSEYRPFAIVAEIPDNGAYMPITKIGEGLFSADFSVIRTDYIIKTNGEPNTFPEDIICVYDNYLDAFDNMCESSDNEIVTLKEYADSVGTDPKRLKTRYY